MARLADRHGPTVAREAGDGRLFREGPVEVQRDVWLDPYIDDIGLAAFATPRYLSVPEP